MGLGSRWKKKWCTTWEKGKGKGKGKGKREQKGEGETGKGQATRSSGDRARDGLSITRALYQWQATSCICTFCISQCNRCGFSQSGYYTEHRQMSDHFKAVSTKARPSSSVHPTTQSPSKGKKKELSTITSVPPLDAAVQLATLLKEKWKRHAPYNFVGCLAHIDITFQSTDGQVLRVVGYLVHNEACQKARMARNPPIPLHPQVYHLALQQLQAGAE